MAFFILAFGAILLVAGGFGVLAFLMDWMVNGELDWKLLGRSGIVMAVSILICLGAINV